MGKIDSTISPPNSVKEHTHTQDNHLNSTNDRVYLTSNDTTNTVMYTDHNHDNPHTTHNNHQQHTATSTAGSSSSMSETSESCDEGERGGSVATSKDSSNDEKLEYTSGNLPYQDTP